MIKAIISDFDGTLVDTFDANYCAYKRAFQEVLDLDFDRDFYFNNFGLRIDNICKLLNIYDENTLKEIKRVKAEYYPTYFDQFNLNINLFNTYQMFKKQGLKLALATTAAHKNIHNALNYLNLTDFFDVIVCGNDVKHGKPDPEVYNIVMNKLEVEPEETLIFEDSVAGIEAATKAGGNVIKINIYK